MTTNELADLLVELADTLPPGALRDRVAAAWAELVREEARA